jgi:hypothetical protein
MAIMKKLRQLLVVALNPAQQDRALKQFGLKRPRKAALHSISFGGEDSADFLKIGSVFVIAAPVPLALGITLDTYVATARALESNVAAVSIAGMTVIVLMLLWYAYPVWRRINAGT